MGRSFQSVHPPYTGPETLRERIEIDLPFLRTPVRVLPMSSHTPLRFREAMMRGADLSQARRKGDCRLLRQTSLDDGGKARLPVKRVGSSNILVGKLETEERCFEVKPDKGITAFDILVQVRQGRLFN